MKRSPVHELASLPLGKTERLLATDGNRGLWCNRFLTGMALDDLRYRQESMGQRERRNNRPAGDVASSISAASGVDHGAGCGAVFETDWRFASGLGLPHPVENGLAWHHTLGVPYLAGSGVKGLVKAWVEVWDESLNDAEREQRLRDWFGTTEQAGCFRFFDALPVEPVKLVADVMTSHCQVVRAGWRDQRLATGTQKVPADWQAPVPVPFLVVKSAKLLFGVTPRCPKFAGELPEFSRH